MDNYFTSYNGKKTEYIFPEIIIHSNTSSRPQSDDSSENDIYMEAHRAVEKFNPYTLRESHPIALEAWCYGLSRLFYEVTEGLYMLEDGTIKLKVKKKYG